MWKEVEYGVDNDVEQLVSEGLNSVESNSIFQALRLSRVSFQKD